MARRPVTYEWSGPLPSHRALPPCALYDVVMTFRHAADGDGVGKLRKALTPLAGEPKLRHWPFREPRLIWSSARWTLQVRIGKASAEIRLGHRIKPNALHDLLTALRAVPGAVDLRVSATVPSDEPRTDEGGGAACCN